MMVKKVIEGKVMGEENGLYRFYRKCLGWSMLLVSGRRKET
jgi:hypothetical protein